MVRALRRHLAENDIDVVHCHQYTPWVYGTLAAWGLKTRVLFTEHGRFHPDFASPKRRFVNPWLARLTTRDTAISNATRAALVEHEYLRGDRIQTVYNGIEPVQVDSEEVSRLRSSLGLKAESVLLGTVARFDPVKNHEMMLRAFRKVLDTQPGCRLAIVGDGEQRPVIEAEIAALDLQGKVFLPGYLSDPTVWIAAMDLFLLSSHTEGTSMTLLEAMSLDKPSVVTAVGGNPEIVLHRETGRVSQANDADGFAGEILDLLSDREVFTETGNAAGKRFQECFHCSVMQQAYDTIYREMVSVAVTTRD